MAGLVAGIGGKRRFPKSVWAERRPNAISELYTSKLNAIHPAIVVSIDFAIQFHV